jgi:hypothetical protein
MFEIQLTQGQVAIVDAIDADLAQFKWSAAFRPDYGDGGRYVASRKLRVSSCPYKATTLLMHRVIMSRVMDRPLFRWEIVDHIHGLTLDNRRSELRLATPSQSNMNRGLPRNSTTGLKGVTWSNYAHKWMAKIRINRKSKTLGYFDTPEEAHEVYKKAAIDLFGEFVNLGY